MRHTFILIHALDRDLATACEIKRHGLPHRVEIVLDDFCAGDKHAVLGEEKIRIAAAAVEDRNISCCKIVPRYGNLHSHIFVPAPLGSSSSGSSRVALSIRLVISLPRKFPKGRTLLDIMPATSILCKASSVPPASGPAVAPRARLLCKQPTGRVVTLCRFVIAQLCGTLSRTCSQQANTGVCVYRTWYLHHVQCNNTDHKHTSLFPISSYLHLNVESEHILLQHDAGPLTILVGIDIRLDP